MTARSSSFLCPKRPNAPTSAAAFAQLLSSQRLSSQRSSPSGPLASTPSAIVPAVQRLCSGIAPVLASPQCYLRHRCGSYPEHKNADYVLETPENGKRLRDYVSAIKRKQGELPCYSFVHLSGRRSRYASEFEPGGKAAVLLSTSDR